ncbi:zinc ABC transporter substrate-binding protein [Paenibacillaceae bacterium]|nr:zinc ABC transporter substrate-binding protein [Paenibacillaceae bacterium]
MRNGMQKIAVLFAVLALVLSACGANNNTRTNSAVSSENGSSTSADKETASDGKKLKIVTTIYPMLEFSRQVAGDYADVVGLIPAGTEPHDWEPSPKDIAQIKEADVFIYNGIVEEWVEKALDSAKNDRRVVVEASRNLELMEGNAHSHDHDGEDHDHDHGSEDHDHGSEDHDHESDDHGLDPHVWLSPLLAQKQVEAIQIALETADPANAEHFKENAGAYIAKLQQLDQTFIAGLKDVKNKTFVTQHAAFGYLAKQYGLKQISISGISPDQEPSPAKMAEIVKLAKDNNISTIFFETLVDPKVAQTIANEIGARTDILNPLEGLTAEEQQKNLDYISVMRNNLDALQKALNE